MIRINLVPPEYPAKQHAKVQAARLAAGAVLAAFVFVLITLGHIKSTFDAEKTLKQKQAQLQVFQDKVSKVRELENVKSSVEGHLSAIDMLLNGRLYYTNFIKDLLQTLPSSVWFGALNTTVKQASGSIDFNITASARSAEDFAAWYASLDQPGGRFSSAKLNGGLSINKENLAYTYSFSISGVYTQPQK